MKYPTNFVSLYNIVPLLIMGGVALSISFYLCLLASPVYVYLLPVFAAFLIASFVSFYRTDQKMKAASAPTAAYLFYKGSKISYVAFFLYLLSVCFVFLPVYAHGGHLFIWFCAPLAVLCLITGLHAKKQQKNVVIEALQEEKKIN